MTSPRPSSSVCSGWRPPGSVPETSAASHQDPRPPPFAGAPLWAGAVSSGWAASVALLVRPVLGCRCAGAGVARSGDVLDVRGGGSGSDDGGGFAGGGAAGEDGALGAGAGAGRGGGVAASGAGVGGSACDGAAPGPAGNPSFPSRGPWCSCSRSPWQPGGESARPSTSFWLPSALAGPGGKHRARSGWALACPGCRSSLTSVSPLALRRQKSQAS